MIKRLSSEWLLALVSFQETTVGATNREQAFEGRKA
jgi:hypothetical protein